MPSRGRWSKAQDAELAHFRERSNFAATPSARVRELLSHWKKDVEFFSSRTVLAVGGGAGIIHQLPKTQLSVSLDPLNPSIFPDLSEDSNAEGVGGVGESIPFPDNTFDIVISANVLDHTSNPPSTLEEVARVLEPRGTFLFEVNVFRARRWTRRLADMFDRPHPHHFDPVDIQELLLDAFEVVRLTDSIRIPFGASASLIGRAKVFIANTLLGLRKVYYVCRPQEVPDSQSSTEEVRADGQQH